MATLAVDAMGGDFGPQVTVPATLQAVEACKGLRVLLFGQKKLIESYLPKGLPAELGDRITILHCETMVANDESPAKAVRYKKQSSMAKMLEAVKTGAAEGCVSAGNTGALMALGKHTLGMSDSMERPAIISSLPRADGGRTLMLDLGANIGCDSELLYQFALMGCAVARCLDESGARPRVALLNVGSEASKGNDQVKAANELLLADPEIEYVGYIEGSDLFSGAAEVVVCDGFVGNVALKTMEGLARYIIAQVGQQFVHTWWQRLAKWLLWLFWQPIERTINPAAYSGAVLVGLQGLTVKTHGGSSIEEFARALVLAVEYVDKNFVARVESELQGH